LQISTGWNEFDHQDVIAVYKQEFAEPAAMKYYLHQQAYPYRAFIALFSQAIHHWQQTPTSVNMVNLGGLFNSGGTVVCSSWSNTLMMIKPYLCSLQLASLAQ
jgi:hypothetical protein